MAPLPPRVAVIGSGRWGRNHVRVLSQLGALAAVCDSDPSALAEARQYAGDAVLATSLDQLPDLGLNAVVIATPAETHYHLARWALEQGLDVLVEKPFCLSLREATELYQTMRQLDRKLMVGHVLLHHPAVVRLFELVQEGVIGRLQYVYSHRLSLGRLRRTENILWSFAPHDVAVMLQLAGELPCQVVACGMTCVRPQVADVTVTHLTFPKQVQGHIHVSWLHPFKEQRLVVIGTKGMLVFDDVAKELVLHKKCVGWDNGEPTLQDGDCVSVPFDAEEPLKVQDKAFLKYVAEGEEPITTGLHGVAVTAVLEAAQRSLASAGVPTPVPDLWQLSHGTCSTNALS